MNRRELFTAIPALFLKQDEPKPRPIEERLTELEIAQVLAFYQTLYLLNLTRTRELNLPPIDRKGNNMYQPEAEEIT